MSAIGPLREKKRTSTPKCNQARQSLSRTLPLAFQSLRIRDCANRAEHRQLGNPRGAVQRYQLLRFPPEKYPRARCCPVSQQHHPEPWTFCRPRCGNPFCPSASKQFAHGVLMSGGMRARFHFPPYNHPLPPGDPPPPFGASVVPRQRGQFVDHRVGPDPSDGGPKLRRHPVRRR
jgi:hypothetical protein